MKPPLASLQLLPVLEELARGVRAGSAHDPAAGVRTRAAQIERANRCPVLGPTRHGPQEEELIGTHLAVEDVAARHAVLFLEVLR